MHQRRRSGPTANKTRIKPRTAKTRTTASESATFSVNAGNYLMVTTATNHRVS